MRIWLTVTLCWWLVEPALALKVRVVDASGNAVANAKVSIIGHTGQALTDRQGRFSWEPDPVPPFELLVVLAGGQYAAPILVERLDPGKELRVRLAPLVANTLTVSSGFTPHIEAPAASGMTLLKREELEAAQPRRLVDALEEIPGAGHVSEGHAAVPSIRGLARGRTLLLIDGGRVTSERRAGPSATYLDPFFLEGLELARGPGSVAYGSDAFGGVIHARTRRPDPQADWDVRFQGILAAAGMPERSGAFSLSKGFGSGGLLAQTSWRSFDDYESPLGRIDNSSARSRSLLVRAEQGLGPGRLSLGWQSDRGRDIGRPRTNSSQTRFFYPREDSDRLTAAYELAQVKGLSLVKMDFFLGRYRLVTDRDQIPTSDRNRELSESDVEAGDFGFRALAVKPLRQARLEFGVDLNGRFGLTAVSLEKSFDSQDRLLSETRERTIDHAGRVDTGLYLSGELLLKKRVTAAGGARIDRVTTRNRGGSLGTSSTSTEAFSGFGSLTWEPLQGLKLTGQLARGFRDPTLSDRYYAGLSGRGHVTGNPELRAETSRQLDVAVRYRRGNARLAFFFYRYRILNLIERFESVEDFFFFRNRGRALLQGLEWEADWRLRPTLSVRVGAQTSRGSTQYFQALDDVPATSVHLSLTRLIGENGYVKLQSKAFARDNRPGPTERVIPGYGLVSLVGGWKFPSGIQLRLQLRNLLDKDYLISPDRRAVLAPGRSAVVTLGFAL